MEGLLFVQPWVLGRSAAAPKALASNAKGSEASRSVARTRVAVPELRRRPRRRCGATVKAPNRSRSPVLRGFMAIYGRYGPLYLVQWPWQAPKNHVEP